MPTDSQDGPDDSFGGSNDMPDEPLERDLGGDDFGGDFGDAGGGEEAASGWDMLRDFFSDD